jgi:hypothetical protein
MLMAVKVTGVAVVQLSYGNDLQWWLTSDTVNLAEPSNGAEG